MPARVIAIALMWTLSSGTAPPFGPLQADLTDPLVLVMPFAVSVDPSAPGGAGAALWLGEAAAVLVTDGLTALGVRALPRAARLAAFERLDLPMASTLTRATMIRVGELVGASAIVFGEASLADRLTIRARFVDLTAGAETTPVADEAELSDLFPLFDRVTTTLAARLGRPAESDAPVLAPLPVEVFENYAKGLVAATPEARRRFLEAAMVQAPRDDRVLLELWRVYTALGLPEKALEAASAVPAEAPRARPARLALALSLIELGRLDGALRELSTMQAERASAVIANALGVVELRRTGASPADAVRHFSTAADAAPDNPDYAFNLGYARARAGDGAGALAALREVVRLDAADADTHALMGVLLAAAGRPAEARRERELAASLGSAADGLDDTIVPDRLERLPLEIDPESVGVVEAERPGRGDQRATAAYHLERARNLVEARRDREAIGELRRAVYLDPYLDEPHLLLGVVLQRAGRLAEAVDEFRVALWARETAEAQVALGRALAESGDREAARRAATRALELDPNSIEARELLNRIGG